MQDSEGSSDHRGNKNCELWNWTEEQKELAEITIEILLDLNGFCDDFPCHVGYFLLVCRISFFDYFEET